MNARYIHDRGQLPPYNHIFSEGEQGPLYYVLVAPFARKCDLPPGLQRADANGRVISPCPPRVFQNCTQDFARYWPVRTVRLLTAVFSVFTVLFIFLAGREMTGKEQTGLLAAGMAAFLPEFTFRGMNVSNDALLALASAACTYGILRLLRRGFSWPTVWLTSVAAALAILAKLNGIVVAAVLGGVLLLSPAPWRLRLKRLAVLGGALLIVAPWLIRNQLL